MGISSKKTSTKTNQNTTATVQPTNPTFTTDAIGGLAGRTEDFFKGLDPYSLVPGADPLQTQAGQGAAGLTSSPAFGEVASAGPQQVGEQNIADYIARFKNPYDQAVKQSSLAEYDYGAGQQQGQANLDQAQDTTFGGSGGSIEQALLKDRLASGRGALSANLDSAGFQSALAAATDQAGLNQQTGLANAGLGETALSRKLAATTAQGEDARANVGTQSGIGDILRQIKAAQAGAPITALGANADILSRTPLDLLKGSTATGSLSGTTVGKESGASLGDWLNYLASNAKAAASSGGG